MSNSTLLQRELTRPSQLPLAPVPELDDMGASEHFVQFYEDESFLIHSVTGYLAKGFRKGDGAIVIATAAHRAALETSLRQMGMDPRGLIAEGIYQPLDAAETLSKFMVDGSPDPKRFVRVVGAAVANAVASGRALRAFGEMVALLWADGNSSAAIRLEELWNDLAKTYSFSLFCAYPMDAFGGECHGQPFTHVCNAHTRVIPAESYGATTSSVDERMRTISMLQQKAASLEAEIAVRRQAEQSLARRERELSDFLENATEAIHKVGSDGTILWANGAELELLGYSAEEYIGRNIAEFHADSYVIADILTRLNRGEKLHDYEARLKHKDQSIRFVSINSSVYWQDDRFSHTKCFTRDITDRRRAAHLLEKTVAERTARLTETISELEAFSYSISHDMRSPLRAMQGYSRALIRDYNAKLDSKALLWLERIDRAATRLDSLIRDILSYSKVAQGDIDLSPIELSRLVDDIIGQHPQLDSLKHCITVHKLHSVIGHEAYLGQCLSNLIENALKFVAPGVTPRVRVSSEEFNGQVKVAVIDNGIGINPDHRDRIFRIFGRVHSEKAYEGSGIGLAIVSKAVARMGGEVGFDSETGRGSTFWFTLPAVSHAE